VKFVPVFPEFKVLIGRVLSPFHLMAIADTVPLHGGHKVVIVASLVLVGCFHALLHLYPTRKQRAWILTAIGSATFTISSIPFVVHLIAHRGDVSNLVRIPWWSDAGCRIFQANLLACALFLQYPAVTMRIDVFVLSGTLWLEASIMQSISTLSLAGPTTSST